MVRYPCMVYGLILAKAVWKPLTQRRKGLSLSKLFRIDLSNKTRPCAAAKNWFEFF